MLQTHSLGEHAIVLRLGSGISMHIHERVMAYKDAITAANFPWVKELVPAFDTLTVYYSISIIRSLVSVTSIADWVADTLKQIPVADTIAYSAALKKIEIPVCYDISMGTDLVFLSEKLKMSIEEIIAIHSNHTYTVYMLGFLPGFPYMGTVDTRIQISRKESPALQVAAGSVGIAGAQTGIYPLQSPGGWQIIGRTPLQIFDVEKESPCLISAGDQVIFKPISIYEFNEIQKQIQA